MAKQQEKSEKESMLEDILRGKNFKKIIYIMLVIGLIMIPAAIAYRVAFSPIEYKADGVDLKVQSISPINK